MKIDDHEWNEIGRVRPTDPQEMQIQWQCRRCGDKWWTKGKSPFQHSQIPGPPTRAEYPTDCNATIITKVMKS